MAGHCGIEGSLLTRRRKAASSSLRFLLLGAAGILGAVLAAWAEGRPEMGALGATALAAWPAAILSEALGVFGFLRFGWWLSHLRAIDQALAGEGSSLVEESSHDFDFFAFGSEER